MDEQLAHAKQLILQLLTNVSFEYCARLKQRLNSDLASRGLPPFNEHEYGSKKFSQFLETQLDDRLSLERPVGPGDIRVSLKNPPIGAEHAGCGFKREQLMVVRSDIWQAFTNPDEKRKRYLNRITSEVVHFIEGVQGEFEFRQKVQAAPQSYIEIEFIPAAAQQAWMQEFLDRLDLPAAESAPLESLITSEYSSSVNTAFTKALGSRGQEWREIRTLKITQHIKDWATQHNVKHEDLSFQWHSEITQSTSPTEAPVRVLTPREQAAKLLERMSDEDILVVAIPVLLSSVLSKSRI